MERMAGATGLEPATYGVTGRHSNQLSYAPAGASPSRGRPVLGRTSKPVKTMRLSLPDGPGLKENRAASVAAALRGR